ncbi:uncharacterized protein B0I36DRAFT_146905 [Microdochium trichocladiopsis]|uniref:Uncharacterized protein n=1 Tax=Microdochium trichocladiopsis TaxID=1682393 RepID=A0A9P8Y522_9PEZI|nr:uncharacterized protein B0I36DRAFT_146905 [Microdochium trichocladiopsis]KAH7028077.1 hypothetical protein B0I36DRAFT_146905 [Microdochium trichocladiopsis]
MALKQAMTLISPCSSSSYSNIFLTSHIKTRHVLLWTRRLVARRPGATAVLILDADLPSVGFVGMVHPCPSLQLHMSITVPGPWISPRLHLFCTQELCCRAARATVHDAFAPLPDLLAPWIFLETARGGSSQRHHHEIRSFKKKENAFRFSPESCVI